MDNAALVTIKPARTEKDLSDAASLFIAYVAWLGLDLTFQDFTSEVNSLPGKFASPGGEILLARDARGQALGCVALRPIDPKGCCEMKRLYIQPAGRGMGLGRRLVKEILGIASSKGYSEIKLDTMPYMTQAISLYEKAGFVSIPPYYENPYREAIFLGKKLEII